MLLLANPSRDKWLRWPSDNDIKEYFDRLLITFNHMLYFLFFLNLNLEAAFIDILVCQHN